MLFDLLADPFDVRLEIFQQHTSSIKQPGKSSIRVQSGEMTIENHAVKRRQRSMHAILVYTQKCIHDLSWHNERWLRFVRLFRLE
ncbi:MAG: hypothetical protein KJ606_01770 [Chloroflexi bacterium]|nr:hypothetical protein [Chloroflexota bacterium]